MIADLNTARRRRLEEKAVSAALELLALTGAAAVVLPLSKTSPTLCLAIGEPEQIREGLANLQESPVAGEDSH